MAIPLKKELLDDYLFQGCERSKSGGYSPVNQPISGTTMHKRLVRVGQILGWEGNATAYTLRYMAGNNMNECGMNIWAPISRLVQR